MKDKLFLFFGCSWTYGKYISTSPEQNNLEYELAQADLYAYRSLISRHFDADQKVFAEGGSSNQRQFRYAAQHFLGPDLIKLNQAKLYSDRYQALKDESWPSVEDFTATGYLPNNILKEIIEQHGADVFEVFKTDERPKYVLWFITSTARTEFFDTIKRNYINEFYIDPSHPVTKSLAVNCYDHTNEVEKLAQQMSLWNAYFASQGIKNVWIDTFNHHDYPIKIKNYIKLNDTASDIMSNMCINLGYDGFKNSEFHTSNHRADDTRSKFLAEKNMLNNKTFHPTIKGHELIAEILVPKIEQHFNNLNNV